MAHFQNPSWCLCVSLIFIALSVRTSAIWLNHGSNIFNTRSTNESLISPRTAQNLRLRWEFFAGKDISATPAIANGVVYFPSWNGFLYAVNAFNGSLVWKQNLTELTGLRGTSGYVDEVVSRATPTVTGDLLVVSIYGPAAVIAVRRNSGGLVWLTKIDQNPKAVITTSGTAHKGEIFVGVSSLEETLPRNQCCIFRGSMVKLDNQSGAIGWQTYTIPDNGGKLDGYSGAAIWGSSPAIDPSRQLVYVATGNLYTAPPEVTKCQEEQNNQTTRPTHPDQCIGKDVHFNSIMAFDTKTGKIKWATQLGGYDVWYIACLVPNNPDCPPGPNLDVDFGEAPMLLSIWWNRRRHDVVVAVQKSGFTWTLDRDTGDIVWFKSAGPGGILGGGIWGAATDGNWIYTNIANSGRERFTLAPSNQTTTAGAWVALDANSGEILWSTANPSNDFTIGPVSVANGVVMAGSVAPDGPIYAMDASNGKILWSYNTGATVFGGMSVSYGCMYLGNGYKVGLGLFPTWTAGTSLYAFCV